MPLTVADVIARTLRDRGIDLVFGLPGGENVPLVASLDREGIRFVLMHHESRAAWAADAYARIGRRVGVCLSTLGPGAVNLAAGLAQAYLDRSPVVAITAQLPAHMLNHHSHQRLDLHSVFSPVAKACYVIGSGSHPLAVVSQALRTVSEGRLGPVHIQVSSPALLQTAELYHDEFHDESTEPTASPESLEAAISLLSRAKRPVIVVGLAAEPCAPYLLLRQLAEELRAPLIVTPKAKGAIPASHALYAGVLGLERREVSADIIGKADLILGVGFDPVELMVPWSFGAPYIHTGPAPNQDPELKAAVNIVGDLSAILDALVNALPPADDSGRVAWHTKELQSRFHSSARILNNEKLMPSQVIHISRELLPQQGIAVSDVGAHKLLIGKLWTSEIPNRFLVSNGLSTMGYALPAAIGAKLACPDLPVVCFIGDGGMAMVDSELETAVRLKLPIIVIVFADEAMSLIRLKQEVSGHKPVGTVMGRTAWAQLAIAYGANGVSVNTPEAFSAAFSSAMQADMPTLIEARIDPAEYKTF